MPDTPQDVAADAKQQLAALEKQQNAQLVAEYQRIWQRIQVDLAALTAEIKAAQDAGVTVNRTWLLQNQRLQALLAQVQAEIGVTAAATEWTLTQQQADAVVAGAQAATQMIQTQVAFAPAFPTFAFAEIVGFAQDGQPLGQLLAELGPAAAEAVGNQLIDGVALGLNPEAIARNIRDALGGNMARAVTIARTEMLRAFRESSRRTYQDNGDVVDQWMWWAELDEDVCPVCVAMHGELFDTDEMMETHPNCRCVMLPVVEGGILATEGVEAGADWFDGLSDAAQQRILGPAKFAAFKAGDITLADLVQKTESKRWGGGRREASLAAALENHN